MSEHELWARLHQGPEPVNAPGLSDRVIRTAIARRRRRAALSAAALVVVLAGGAAAITFGGGQGRLAPPASVTEVITPSTRTGPPSPSTEQTSPSAPATTSMPTTPTESARGSSSPPPSGSAPARAVTLLHEGEVFSGTVEPGANTPWRAITAVPGPCLELAPAVARHGGTLAKAIGRDAAANYLSESLVTFPDAASAVAFLAELRRQAGSCLQLTGGQRAALLEPFTGTWGDGFAAVTGHATNPVQTPPAYGGLGTFVAARVGRAVTTASFAGDGTTTGLAADPGLVADLRPAIEHVVPQLCGYTAAGC